MRRVIFRSQIASMTRAASGTLHIRLTNAGVAPPAPEPHRRQKGGAAIEFALVFPIVFLLVYGLITYGLILLAQQTLQLGVSEGARAALRYSTSPAAAAISAVNAQTTWLASSGLMTVQATMIACPYASVSSCLKVTASYPYASNPLVPTLPFLSLVLPSTLSAAATVQLEPSVVTSTTAS